MHVLCYCCWKTIVLHQLTLHKLKDIICACAIESCYDLESYHSEISEIFESGLRLQGCSQWNCHVNGTTFQSDLRFQTGLNSLRISCKCALEISYLISLLASEICKKANVHTSSHFECELLLFSQNQRLK